MHTMDFVGEFLGVETWRCPECGRVVLVRWHPYERVVDVEGDPSAGHRAMKMPIADGLIGISERLEP